MKKFTTFTIRISLLLAFVLVLQSCLNNHDEDLYYGQNALVTAKTNSNDVFYLQLNDSTTLLPTNIKTSPFGKKEVRALVRYYDTERISDEFDRTVHVNWIDSILTKNAVPDFGMQNDSLYGNDPVDIINDWVTIAEDSYLTLRFRTYWGYGNIPHEVNLVTGINKENPYEVEFRHNAHKDVSGHIGDALVAFSLKDLPDTEGKTVKLTLKWNSFYGERSATFDYCTHKSTSSSTILTQGSEFKTDIE